MEILWITKYIEEIFDEEFQKETEKTKYFKEDYPKDVFTELREHYSKEFFDEEQKLYSYFAFLKKVICLANGEVMQMMGTV